LCGNLDKTVAFLQELVQSPCNVLEPSMASSDLGPGLLISVAGSRAPTRDSAASREPIKCLPPPAGPNPKPLSDSPRRAARFWWFVLVPADNTFPYPTLRWPDSAFRDSAFRERLLVNGTRAPMWLLFAIAPSPLPTVEVLPVPILMGVWVGREAAGVLRGAYTCGAYACNLRRLAASSAGDGDETISDSALASASTPLTPPGLDMPVARLPAPTPLAPPPRRIRVRCSSPGTETAIYKENASCLTPDAAASLPRPAAASPMDRPLMDPPMPERADSRPLATPGLGLPAAWSLCCPSSDDAFSRSRGAPWTVDCPSKASRPVTVLVDTPPRYRRRAYGSGVSRGTGESKL